MWRRLAVFPVSSTAFAQPVRFTGMNWTVDLAVKVTSRVSAVTGNTWLYVDLDDEHVDSFGMVLSLVLHAYVGGKEFKIPLETNDYKRLIRRSYSKELEAGSVGRVFLELVSGYGTSSWTREVYSGPVFADAGCIRDYYRAKRLDGVAARERMNKVVSTGCLRLPRNPAVVDLENDNSPSIDGMRKAFVLFDGEEPSAERGYIIPSLRRTVSSTSHTQIASEELPMESADIGIIQGRVKTDNRKSCGKCAEPL